MKRRLVIATVTLMLVLIPLGGCAESGIGDKYITVDVQLKACATVKFYMEDAGWIIRKWIGGILHLEIVQTNGERVTFDEATDSDGCTEIVTGTFKVYKEQSVEAVVTITGGTLPLVLGGGIYDPNEYEISNNQTVIHWDEIKTVDFGNTYYWNPVIDMEFSPK